MLQPIFRVKPFSVHFISHPGIRIATSVEKNLKMHDKITGLILAGGKGRRMGAVNKGALEISDGLTMAEQVIITMQPQVSELFISANDYSDFYRKFGFSVLEDKRPGYLGPLSGIESLLIEKPDIEWLFCATVDTPFFPPNLASELLELAVKNNVLCVTPIHNGNRHPLHSIINSKLFPSLTRFLDEGQRSAGYWLKQCGALEYQVDAPYPCFENINTPEELINFRKML